MKVIKSNSTSLFAFNFTSAINNIVIFLNLYAAIYSELLYYAKEADTTTERQYNQSKKEKQSSEAISTSAHCTHH